MLKYLAETGLLKYEQLKSEAHKEEIQEHQSHLKGGHNSDQNYNPPQTRKPCTNPNPNCVLDKTSGMLCDLFGQHLSAKFLRYLQFQCAV